MKNTIMVIIVLVMLCIASIGCAEKEDDKLIIGIMEDYPPMVYRNTAGELVGFEVDLAVAISSKLDMDFEFLVVDRQNMMGILKSKEVDMLIASVSYTDEKDKYAYVDFSVPYLHNGHVIVTTPEHANTISSLENLNGMVVGVETNSSADAITTAHKDQFNFTLMHYDKMSVCFAALKAEQLDCLICDMPIAIDIVAKNPHRFVVSSTQLTNEPLAIAINIGNEKLQVKLNDAIKALQEEGILSELSIEYMGKDYTENYTY